MYEKDQYSNAQVIFDRIAEDHWNNDRERQMNAQYYAARCAIQLYHGDTEERLLAFQDHYPLSPLVNRLFITYANNRFSLKRYRDALEFYEKVDPYALESADRSEYYFKKAYSLLSLEKFSEAKELFFKIKDDGSSFASTSKYYYAHLLYIDQQYREALNNFLPLQDDPSFGALVPYYLAHIYYALEDDQALVAVGSELIEKASPNRIPEIAKLVADAHDRLGQYPAVIRYLEIYDQKGGRMRLVDHFQLGYAHYQTGNYARAIQSFNKIDRGPDELVQNAYYHLGDCYLKRGEKAEARTAFKAASELDANPEIQESAYYNYAKLAYELADPFRDAISTLNAFLRQYPQSPHRPEINGFLANLYITTKDYDKALISIREAGLEAPGMQAAYQRISFYRGNELHQARKFAGALKQYQEALSYPIIPRITALCHYWSGEALYQLERYQEALAAYQDFRSAPGSATLPEFNLSYYQSGYAHFKAMDFQPAARDLRLYIAEAPQQDGKRYSDALLRLGDSYLLTGGYLVAAQYYQKAIKQNTAEADYAYFQKAQCLGLDGKKLEKIKALRTLTEQFPKSRYAQEAQMVMAETYLRLDRYAEALSALATFEQRYPQSERLANVQVKKGLIYSNMDQNTQAIALFRKVVQDYPATQEALEAIKLAEIAYKRLNQIEVYLDWVDGIAFVDFEQSKLDSTSFNASFDLYAQGDYEEALRSFRGYISRFEAGLFLTKANYYAARSALQQGDSAAAMPFYQNLLDRPQNAYTAEALWITAQQAERQGDMTGARKYYQRLANLSEDRQTQLKAQFGLLRSAQALGDYATSVLYADLILNAQPKNKEWVRLARLYKARAYYAQEEWLAAYHSYADLARRSTGLDLAESYYRRALILQRQTRYDSSNVLVNEMIEELPSFQEYKLKGLLVMAENFWQMKDLFQANYILDFILENDFSASINQAARNLKQEMAAAQEAQEAAKNRLRQEMRKSIHLDPEGLQLIDEPLEEEIEEDLFDQREE